MFQDMLQQRKTGFGQEMQQSQGLAAQLQAMRDQEKQQGQQGIMGLAQFGIGAATGNPMMMIQGGMSFTQWMGQ